MEVYCYGLKFQHTDKRSLTLLFAGCNFKCPYCYNAQLLDFKKDFLVSIRDIKNEIDLNYEDIDGIIFGGGEPSLQRQALKTLCRYARSKNLKTILLTNGSSPQTLKSLIMERLLSKVVFDIKSPFNEHFEKITRSRTYFKDTKEIISDIKESLNLVRNSYLVETEMKTVVVPNLIYRREDLLKIAEIVNNTSKNWTLARFIPHNTAEKRYEQIKSPSLKFMNHIKKLCMAKYPSLNINIL